MALQLSKRADLSLKVDFEILRHQDKSIRGCTFSFYVCNKGNKSASHYRTSSDAARHHCLKKPRFLHDFACNQQFGTQSRLNPELVNCLQSSCDFLCRVLLWKRDFLCKAS
jgi:hypothetical protein